MNLARRSATLTLLAATAPMLAGGITVAPAAHAATRYCASVTPLSQRPGNNGWCVQELQSRLTLNARAVKQTHSFDGATATQVKAFQKAKSLPATDVVNRATWLDLMGGNAQETPAYTSSGQYLENRGPNHTKRVVLSFDDCPRSYSAFKATVDAAAAPKITVVLAATGECQAGKNFDAAYARSKGQLVIGHSNTHPNLRNLSDAQLRAQIDPASAASGYMRPPFGSWDAGVTRVMAAKGVRMWAWTRDTCDWAGASQAQIVSYVNATSQHGDTILGHMSWNAFNPAALTQIKAGLAKRGVVLCQAYVGRTSPTKLPANLPC